MLLCLFAVTFFRSPTHMSLYKPAVILRYLTKQTQNSEGIYRSGHGNAKPEKRDRGRRCELSVATVASGSHKRQLDRREKKLSWISIGVLNYDYWRLGDDAAGSVKELVENWELRNQKHRNKQWETRKKERNNRRKHTVLNGRWEQPLPKAIDKRLSIEKLREQ
jgi:hypothetical protein